MNIDELKQSWKKYDQQLAAQSVLNEKLIKNILKEKSHSLLDQMRRRYIFAFLYLLAFTAFCVVSILYNAFDFNHIIQYLPLVLYILASLFILWLLGNGFKITRIEIDKENLVGSIHKVLNLHQKFVSRTAKAKFIFIFSGFLFPLSFLPRIYAGKGSLPAAGLVLGTIAMIAVLFLLFRKLGLFRDRFAEKLVNNLKELEEYEELSDKAFQSR